MSTEYVPQSVKVAAKATSTAHMIGVLKVVALVLNAIGSVVYVAVGVAASRPTTTFETREDGFQIPHESTSPFGGLFIGAGVTSLVVGTVLILVLFGWFQHMLATNAEILRRLDRQ